MQFDEDFVAEKFLKNVQDVSAQDFLLNIKSKILPQDFYNRDTLKVAKDLLGCFLVKKEQDGNLKIGKIVETEAYTSDDPACHAYRGKTKRSITLFKEPGLAYVYFTYGMYHCMNVVTEPFDTAGAVLIRALEPILNISNTNGPAKLCREMNITREYNETPVFDSNSMIFLLRGKTYDDDEIVKTTRIGIKVATDYPWRFYLKDNDWVSKK